MFPVRKEKKRQMKGKNFFGKNERCEKESVADGYDAVPVCFGLFVPGVRP